MSQIVKLLAVCLALSCFISQGDAQCELNNIKITQNATGDSIHGEPEYAVSIYSDCPCSQYDVYFNMTGFESTLFVDSNVLNTENGLINNGGLLPREESAALKFNYASERFEFKPVKSKIACSRKMF